MSLTDDFTVADPTPGQTDLEGGVVDEFKQEAGEAVGPMPPQEPRDEAAPPPEDLVIAGTVQLGLFDAGGKQPTSSSLRLTGGKFGLMDQQAFTKGDVVRFEVTAVIDTVTVKDKTDRNLGVVLSCEQQHSAYITDARLLKD